MECKCLCVNQVQFVHPDEYEAVIVCLGAKVDMLAELAGLLPLRACRGVVSHLQLHDLMW